MAKRQLSWPNSRFTRKNERLQQSSCGVKAAFYHKRCISFAAFHPNDFD
jgi:hypothetical protein